MDTYIDRNWFLLSGEDLNDFHWQQYKSDHLYYLMLPTYTSGWIAGFTDGKCIMHLGKYGHEITFDADFAKCRDEVKDLMRMYWSE